MLRGKVHTRIWQCGRTEQYELIIIPNLDFMNDFLRRSLIVDVLWSAYISLYYECCDCCVIFKASAEIITTTTSCSPQFNLLLIFYESLESIAKLWRKVTTIRTTSLCIHIPKTTLLWFVGWIGLHKLDSLVVINFQLPRWRRRICNRNFGNVTRVERAQFC